MMIEILTCLGIVIGIPLAACAIVGFWYLVFKFITSEFTWNHPKTIIIPCVILIVALWTYRVYDLRNPSWELQSQIEQVQE